MNHVPSGSPKVEIRGVSKRFGDTDTGVLALDDVSLQIDNGEFVAIVGPSGCGKSTLLRIVADLQTADTGEVTVHDQHPGQPTSAMVFQEHALFPWLTVQQNIVFGPRNRKIDKAVYDAEAASQIERIGLDGFADRYPHQLSGGMKQRVGIARALTQNPEVLLMDEPLGALDAQTRTLLQEQILEVRQRARPTCLYVTHAIDEALFLADRVVLMTARPGRISRIIQVPFEGERTPELRGSAAFAELSQEIWEHLRVEVQKTMSSEKGG